MPDQGKRYIVETQTQPRGIEDMNNLSTEMKLALRTEVARLRQERFDLSRLMQSVPNDYRTRG